MPSLFITVDGTELLINRVERAAIDTFVAAHPEPQPPSIKVEVWGGILEDIPDYEDLTYKQEVRTFRLGLGQDQMSIIFPAIRIVGNPPVPSQELLTLLKKEKLTDYELMQYVILADKNDLEYIVDEVLYLSTVTIRGVIEAQKAFNVRWMDKDVTKWKVAQLPADYTPLFRDRQVAKYCDYNWNSFCELTGPEQSACVAYYLADRMLEYLSSKWS